MSKEDIILSKLGRYYQKDIEDISISLKEVDKKLLAKLIESVKLRENLSEKIREKFIENVKLFKVKFDVEFSYRSN